jgi:transcriptional regulator with XRE-family HTH domain
VESEPPPVAGGQDPELLAGQELQRLRKARGWSQEEVARRMKAYGYDFNQALISRIELGQRPLRVREMVDFAALFGIQPAALLKPYPEMSLEEIEAEIARLTPQLAELRFQAERLSVAEAETVRIQARLNLLQQRRDYLKGAKDERP